MVVPRFGPGEEVEGRQGGLGSWHSLPLEGADSAKGGGQSGQTQLLWLLSQNHPTGVLGPGWVGDCSFGHSATWTCPCVSLKRPPSVLYIPGANIPCAPSSCHTPPPPEAVGGPDVLMVAL